MFLSVEQLQKIRSIDIFIIRHFIYNIWAFVPINSQRKIIICNILQRHILQRKQSIRGSFRSKAAIARNQKRVKVPGGRLFLFLSKHFLKLRKRRKIQCEKLCNNFHAMISVAYLLSLLFQVERTICQVIDTLCLQQQKPLTDLNLVEKCKHIYYYLFRILINWGFIIVLAFT